MRGGGVVQARALTFSTWLVIGFWNLSDKKGIGTILVAIFHAFSCQLDLRALLNLLTKGSNFFQHTELLFKIFNEEEHEEVNVHKIGFF